MTLYFVTGNKDKFIEVQTVLPDIQQLDIDLPELQSIDPHEVITEKLAQAAKQTSGNLIVEDVSLVIAGMSGLPGPLIRWFLKTIGNEGIAKLSETFGSQATATATIGYTDTSGATHFFDHTIAGSIVTPRGTNGFGWDAIFQPEGQAKTFAEMTPEEKTTFNMRIVAVKKLKAFIDSQK